MTIKSFWNGFEEGKSKLSKTNFKKHVIILYWSKGNEAAKDAIGKMRFKHPTVKVKIVNATDLDRLKAHKVTELPTIILLKNGREVDRVAGAQASSQSMLSHLFRRASV